MVDNMLGPCEASSGSAQGYQSCQVKILTQHGWVSLVCSVEIDLSCICDILFPPRAPLSPPLKCTIYIVFC